MVLKRFYFTLFSDGLTLKTLKLANIGICIQTLYLFCVMKRKKDVDLSTLHAAMKTDFTNGPDNFSLLYTIGYQIPNV